MEKFFSALEELKNINKAYNISVESIEQLQQEMRDAKVCTPVIGKFSSGKSALINTVLGYDNKILKENITPETAVPAEIVYTDAEEGVTIVRQNNTYQNISIDEYRNYQVDANTVKCVKISLTSRLLAQIPDVILVDMPGFESGFAVHNKAIDDYLPQSLAYIITFPADDMIVRSSVGNILRELCLHDMPLCAVITKYDKKNDDFEKTLEKMKENLKHFVGNREIRLCKTSSFTGDAQELEYFLKEIQEQSQDILARKYKAFVLSRIENTETYLKTVFNSSQLSVSELDGKEEKLKVQLSELNAKFTQEQSSFEIEAAECIQEIKNDVQCAMENETDSFVTMAMNNQEINDYLNRIVRNEVTVSVKRRFMPRIKKYLKKIVNVINSESIGDVHIFFDFDAKELDKGIASSVLAVVTGIILGFPVLGMIAGVIAGMITKMQNNKKREETKQKIRMKLENEVYPQVLREVGNGIEQEITKQISLVNTSIREELNRQRDTIEQAMSDVRTKMQDEQTKKENLEMDIKADLERLEELKDGLR